MTATDAQPAEDANAAIAREERRSGWRTINRVAPYLWPDDHPWVKKRVIAAMAVLVLAKLIAVGTPMLYKAAVDTLGGEGSTLLLGAVGLTVAYGMARLMTNGFQQLRDALFAAVGQRALRHQLHLDLAREIAGGESARVLRFRE